jgi:hypothetical protein
MDANLILFVVKAMKRMFCWAFALHTVCSACSGATTCIANLTSSNNLIADSFDLGKISLSEVVVTDSSTVEIVNVPNPSGFACTVPPNGAHLLQFDDLHPFRLRVGENTITFPIKTYQNISIQFSGNIVATTVYLVPVSASKAAVQFHPEISRLLPHADKAIFVEDQERAIVISIFGKDLCHYSPFLIQNLQQELKERRDSGKLAEVTNTNKESRREKYFPRFSCQVS